MRWFTSPRSCIKHARCFMPHAWINRLLGASATVTTSRVMPNHGLQLRGTVWPAPGVFLCVLLLTTPAFCQSLPTHGTASWYSVDSCRREGTSGIMANGRRLDDEAFTAASWDYPFGTTLMVRLRPDQTGPGARQRMVVVTVTDRGPRKTLYRQGRILDLSKKSFEALSPFSAGVIPITVTVERLP